MPYGYGGVPMKTSTPRTMGTLSMVFGAIVVCTSIFGALGGQMSFTKMPPGQQAAFERYIAATHTFTVVQALIMLVMAASLFYIGTGQRGYKRWAAGASVKWGVAALAVVVFNIIGAVTYTMPALDTFINEISHGNSPAAGAIGVAMKVGVFMGFAFNLPYPIIMISVFRKPQNVDAMDQPTAIPTATAL